MQAHIGPDGMLHMEGQIHRAALGRGGIRANKREGDGATPVGMLPLRRVLYRADRIARPRAACLVEPIAPQDGWCDASTDPMYNRQIRLPFAASHEELWRSDGLYDLIGVLGWNDAPPIPSRGSAIFLHVATMDFRPTEGCIAMPLPTLQAILAAGLTHINVQEPT